MAAGFGLQIKIKPVGFDRAFKALANVKNGAPRAISGAINYGLKTGRDTAIKLIRGRYNIGSGALKSEGFVMKTASPGNLSGSLEAKGPMLPVRLFAPSVRLIRRGGRSYQSVSVMIIRGSRRVVKGAFMDGSGRVMERRQPEKYPVFPVSTIGIPSMVGQHNIREQVETVMGETIDKRLDYNINALLGR